MSKSRNRKSRSNKRKRSKSRFRSRLLKGGSGQSSELHSSSIKEKKTTAM